MISFGIMTAFLVAMVCVVHYDLLGLYQVIPFARHFGGGGGGGGGSGSDGGGSDGGGGSGRDNGGGDAHSADELHQQPPMVFDNDWIPRPGTDSKMFHRRPTIFVNDFEFNEDEYENDYWIDDEDDEEARWSDVRVEEDEDSVDTDKAGGTGAQSCPIDGAHDAEAKCSTDGGDVGRQPKDATANGGGPADVWTQPPEPTDRGDDDDGDDEGDEGDDENDDEGDDEGDDKDFTAPEEEREFMFF